MWIALFVAWQIHTEKARQLSWRTWAILPPSYFIVSDGDLFSRRLNVQETERAEKAGASKRRADTHPTTHRNLINGWWWEAGRVFEDYWAYSFHDLGNRRSMGHTYATFPWKQSLTKRFTTNKNQNASQNQPPWGKFHNEMLANITMNHKGENVSDVD